MMLDLKKPHPRKRLTPVGAIDPPRVVTRQSHDWKPMRLPSKVETSETAVEGYRKVFRCRTRRVPE